MFSYLYINVLSIYAYVYVRAPACVCVCVFTNDMTVLSVYCISVLCVLHMYYNPYTLSTRNKYTINLLSDSRCVLYIYIYIYTYLQASDSGQ